MPVLIEFTIEGPPVSAQARNRRYKATWMTRVRSAAQAAGAPAVPFEGDVRAWITYYHEGPAPGRDNMAKPIMDALQGLVFRNDRQVRDLHAQLRNINDPFRLRGISMPLAWAFHRGRVFVHVRVEVAEDSGDLP